jgi:hypothetical protein
MKIQIEATAQNFSDLIAAIESNPELIDIKQQLLTAIAMNVHDQLDEVPKEGDHPIIDRFE